MVLLRPPMMVELERPFVDDLHGAEIVVDLGVRQGAQEHHDRQHGQQYGSSEQDDPVAEVDRHEASNDVLGD